MANTDKLIVVTGATGSQGGAVTRHLLSKGFKIRAFVRDGSKPAALELKKKGVEIFEGNLEDMNALDKAFKGAYGVFSVQNFWEHGYDKEVIQGKNAANAAKEAGVKHFVYSSVASSDQKTGLVHFDSKWEIEKYIHGLNIQYTIVKPVFFMENFHGWFKPVENEGNYSISLAMHKDTKLQMIAVDDIGAIVSVIFENPEKYMNKTIELAGDEPEMLKVAGEFSIKLGKPVSFNEIPIDVLRANSKEMADMFEWFMNVGYKAHIDETRKIHPGLKNFSKWLNL
jgi:uncharacterized protein YbjT (DUF2867 family)